MTDLDLFTKRAQQREEDHLLTMDAVVTLFERMRQDILPRSLHIERADRQVIVSTGSAFDRPFPDDVYDILRTMFPGGEEREKYGIRTTGKGKGKRFWDTFEYRAPLRPVIEEISTPFHPDEPPRLEIWHLRRPHVHRSWHGVIERGRPRWRCDRCNEPLTVREARAKGLVP